MTTPPPMPVQFPGPAFLAVGGGTMGFCHRGCQAYIRGRLVRSVDTGGSGAGGFDVVDGKGHGHDCQGPTGEPTRRYPDPR